jgi:hypothetical protein
MLAKAILPGDSSLQVGLDYVVYAEFHSQSWVRIDIDSPWLTPVPSNTLVSLEPPTGWVVEGD